MDLNDTGYMSQLDSQNMYDQIISLPDQLLNGWRWAAEQDFAPEGPLYHVVICGMGGSAIGAELAAGIVERSCPVPVVVNRGYDLPAWAGGSATLCIGSSHSGNTEETLSCFEQARARGCSLLAFSTGGKLADISKQYGSPLWQFEHAGQPRAAVGISFAMVMASLWRAGLITDPRLELTAAVTTIKDDMTGWRRESLVNVNPAKRLAGQCVGRNVTVFGADFMAPVARRWKGQINELAKAVANFEVLPEADHNTLAGTDNPEGVLQAMIALFLRSAHNHDRNALRLEHTQRLMTAAGINTDSFASNGRSEIEDMWRTIVFGDLMAYYLAMAYGVDPTPIPAISDLKQLLS